MSNDFIIFLAIAGLLVWGFYQKKQKEKKKAALSVDTPMDSSRQLIAEIAPAIMKDYEVFTDSFLMRFSDEFIRNGKYTGLSKDDVLEGVDFDHARWIYSHCSSIASCRCAQINSLNQMKEAEVDTVELKVSRANPNCSHVPSEGKIEIDKALVYPCADCKEDKPCDIWYKPLV